MPAGSSRTVCASTNSHCSAGVTLVSSVLRSRTYSVGAIPEGLIACDRARGCSHSILFADLGLDYGQFGLLVVICMLPGVVISLPSGICCRFVPLEPTEMAVK